MQRVLPRASASVSLLAVLGVASMLVASPRARAEVRQPNGVVMPVDSMNGETQLYTLFSSRGEGIDYQRDGGSAPAVFSPLCDFRATLVLNQTASHLAVGWYNTDGATTVAALADIHVIVPVDSPVGTVITGSDIRSNPAYTGGLVGFALVGWQTHFTEARLNPMCTTCGTPGPWVMSVIYSSLVTANAYYVSFEDGDVSDSPSGFGNDGDYNDYVYFFEGLTCAGGGVPCDTGMLGICAAGLTECTSTGTRCVPTTGSRAETCNGLDDDCDGTVDGDGLCSVGEVCDRGVCVGRCFEGGCDPGYECSSDTSTCIETACAGMTCTAGEVCHDGVCAGPCAGVVCPGDLVCRAGRCVDACAGVTCPMDRVCSGGVCVAGCSCGGCGAGLTCVASGRCEMASCVGIDCSAMPGTVCRAGACVDACAAATCPRGQACVAGACVDVGGGSGGGDAGTGGGGGGDGGVRMDGGTSGRRVVLPDEGGCGCRVAAPRSRPSTALAMIMLALGALGVLARRRSRRVSTDSRTRRRG